MTAGDWAILISSISAVAMAGIALWKARKTLPAEVDKLRADTAMQYSALAEKAAKRTIEIDERCEELEKRQDVIEYNFRQAMEYIQVLLDGIDKLIHQLKANHMTPVWTPPDKPKLRDTGELKRK